nr:hypothetical protein [Prevotella sp.]
MKSLRLIHVGVTAIVGCLIFASCNDGGKSKQMQLQAQLDSLSQTDSIHQEDVKSMADFVNVMSTGLDSIAIQQGMLTNIKNSEGKVDKAQLKEQLGEFGNLINRQKSRVAILENQLAKSKTTYSRRIKKLIDFYKVQLNEKDSTIAQLNRDIDSKNVNIAKLTDNVNQLTSTNTELNTTVNDQKNVISSQDMTIHEGYVQMGTAKVLKAKGLLSGGFLAKKQVNVAKLNAAGFNKIDIRNYNDIVLKSKNAKIMSQMPASSYTMTRNANGTCTLHIENITSFWSVSKYLIIKL